jgi:DNA-binding transcriptional regulator YhcF (GntR family)
MQVRQFFSMRFWISKNSEVPVREQLVTQVMLAIASGDLAPGGRLPSTRSIAMRYGIHPNTVAAAYRSLVERRYIELRRGSGHFVGEPANGRMPSTPALESLIDLLISECKNRGLSPSELASMIEIRSRVRAAKRILVVESDPGLCEIIVHEISSAMDTDISAISFEEFAAEPDPAGALIVAFSDEKPKIDPLLASDNACIYLRGRSVAGVLSDETRPGEDDLIGVFSGWQGFLTFARVMLAAARIGPGNIVVRSTNEPDWCRSADLVSTVICDQVTSQHLHTHPRVKVFSLISDESISELRSKLEFSVSDAA